MWGPTFFHRPIIAFGSGFNTEEVHMMDLTAAFQILVITYGLFGKWNKDLLHLV